VSQDKRSAKNASELDITEAQRTRLISLFKSARQKNASAAEIQKQLNSILTPAQQKRLAKFLDDDGGDSGAALEAYTDSGEQGRRWTA
jgi:hypothetical protein